MKPINRVNLKLSPEARLPYASGGSKPSLSGNLSFKDRSQSVEARKKGPIPQYQDAIESFVARNAYNHALNEYNANRSLGARKNYESDYLKIAEDHLPIVKLRQKTKECDLPISLEPKIMTKEPHRSINVTTTKKMRQVRMKRNFYSAAK